MVSISIGKYLESNKKLEISFLDTDNNASALGVVSVDEKSETFTYISGQDLARIEANPSMSEHIWQDTSRHHRMSFHQIQLEQSTIGEQGTLPSIKSVSKNTLDAWPTLDGNKEFLSIDQVWTAVKKGNKP